MRKSAIVVVLVLAAMVLAVGCGDKAGVWRPAGSPGFVDLEGKKILIMPADMRYLPGDKLALSAALFGGFLAEFGAAGISLQPIQPALEQIGLGDLSWMLARGMVHAAFFHNSVAWDACGGEDYSVIPKLVKTLIEKVGELLGIPDLKFDYIAILHIDSLGSPMPKMTKLRVIGGLYDPLKDEIVVAIDWTQTTAEDALLAEMATIGPKAVGIMKGEDPAKKEAK
ncbi:MAG TPA: hypothetical protein PK668_23315 [Myxococcota bacterium]|nr:hypothetical protein [Myxococcota bacterium]HRY96521.1 hypothetical protein [Myxococcota bacterium]HSA24319.1 hypothetical protein [Myxococcota bacterium]